MQREMTEAPAAAGTVTTVDPLTDARWDRFVESHPLGWVCHLSGWQEVLEGNFRQMSATCFVLTSNDEIKAALPVYEVSSWLTGDRLVSIPFATLSDPLISNRDELDQLLDAVRGFSRGRRIEIRTLTTSGYFGDAGPGLTGHYIHHYIPLDRPPEDLMKTFHRTCVRQRISRAVNSGIVVEEGTTEPDLREFYGLYLLSRKRLALPPQPYVFFKSLFDVFQPGGRVSVLLARVGGKTIGSIVLLKFNGRVSAEFACYDETYLNMSPLHALFWEAIKSACAEGYSVFDFGRTPASDASLLDFKERWGTKTMDMHEFHYPAPEGPDTGTAREETLAYKVMRNVCRRSPGFVFPYIGKFCYRHLG